MSRYIDEHRGRFGVEPICSVLDVSASAYYQRATGARSARAVEDERLLKRIGEVHAVDCFAYGYRRTWKAMLRAGEDAGRDHVKRLMRDAGIQGAKRRGKPWRTTIADPAAHRPPDLVKRDFNAPLRPALRASLRDDSTRLAHQQTRAFDPPATVLSPITRCCDHQLTPGNTRASPSSRSSTTTTFWRRSGRSATPLTTRGRELRRHLQDRADRRSRLANPFAAGAGDRRIRRLVQHCAPARVPRGLAAGRVRDPLRHTVRLIPPPQRWKPTNPVSAKVSPAQTLVAAGADPNARCAGPHTETPLHWAASSDDVDAIDALLAAGADLEARGAVIAGGTPIADATAFGQWKAAHQLADWLRQQGARSAIG